LNLNQIYLTLLATCAGLSNSYANFIEDDKLSINLRNFYFDRQFSDPWMMLQTSTFQSEASHLNAAKLRIKFKRNAEGVWKIKHFQTENIFSRPVSHWHSTEALPVPTTDSTKDQA